MEIYIRKLNWLHEEFQSTLNSQNACYRSVQSPVSYVCSQKHKDWSIQNYTFVCCVI